MKPAPVIAIIGGGFSGISVTAQIAGQAERPVKIIVFNYKYPFSKGVAYHTTFLSHLLNVPAAGMSFFADEDTHFVNWLEKRNDVGKNPAARFVQRKIYGDYITDTFNTQLLHSKIDFLLVEEEVVDIENIDGGFTLLTPSGKSFVADKVVFAMGNDEPEVPSYVTNEMINEGVYVNNPWVKESHRLADKKTDIMLLGSGLTMVDNLLSLLAEGFSGRIHVVSTKGFLPVEFKTALPDTEILKALKPPYRINEVFDIFRRHVHRVRSQGITGASVVAALRPMTQTIWLQLSAEDKIRFLTHVRHLWGVARHRLPKEVFDVLSESIASGRLNAMAGRLVGIEMAMTGTLAVIKQRQASEIVKIPVQRIINCTGPLNNITKSKSVLLQNLFRKKIVVPDALHLGIQTEADGSIKGIDDNASQLFAIGPLLKGILWETTAVNEIRQQAKTLAKLLLQ